jgi:hypothetical protein
MTAATGSGFVAVVGLGTTGTHIVRTLTENSTGPALRRLHLHDRDPEAVARSRQIAATTSTTISTGPVKALAGEQPDVVVLATDCGTHADAAAQALTRGSHVVSISDDPDEVLALLALDERATGRNLSLVVGAGMAPGLSCLLARLAGDGLDRVDAINLAKAGTGGPACARQHHRALKRPGRDWVGDGWELRRGGSGRDLAWFPEPIGARDCYRASLPDPILLHRQYPNALRLSARVSATRRDRFTSWLPMLRKPHHDGGPGAVRTEVRGMRNGVVETIVLAVMAYPSESAGAVAANAARAVLDGQAPVGAHGLVRWPEPGRFLQELHPYGITVSAFGGGQMNTGPWQLTEPEESLEAGADDG